LSGSSQYSVLAHSFSEIDALNKNSFRLTEYRASVKFAPIEVPDFNNRSANTYSCFSSRGYLYRLYIFIANFLLLSRTIFIIFINYKTNRKIQTYIGVVL